MAKGGEIERVAPQKAKKIPPKKKLNKGG